ncbi:MAG TPA: ribosome maturation factor RimP [Pyrinomonadaceae bacterium]|nr:ribosome maturation factor RimP [Pyrinomonadaceae bacterium]
MDLGSIEERIQKVAAQVAANRNLEFVKSEIAGTKRSPVVRVFLDKEGGISVEDCAEASRDMESVLDGEDLIPMKYVLEVSSPGLERGLYSLRDFERFSGKLAKLKTRSEINGTRSHVGWIDAVKGENISLRDRKGAVIEVPYDEVEKANLKIDLTSEFRR